MEGGVLFNSLEFLFPEWQIKYDDGLVLQNGVAASNMKFKTLKDFQPGEHIISLAIKVGELTSGGQAIRNEVLPIGVVRKNGVEYNKAHTTFIDVAFSSGSLKGFFGHLDMNPSTGGLLLQEVAPIYDTDKSSIAATIETFRGQVPTDEDETRLVQAELLAAQERERLLNEKKSQLKETIRNLDLEKQRYDLRAKAAENERSDTQNCLNKERQFLIHQVQYGSTNFTSNEKIYSKLLVHLPNSPSSNVQLDRPGQ
ncbi:hypothetical protein HG530_014521 [Fusarium avenaceum]|nr:hypothetical protein HG530_014521 [Fusarium avenaceum]